MKIKFFRKYAFVLMACLFITTVHAKAAPALFDYDGDGKTDILVRRLNSNNNFVWYALESRDGFNATVWGGYVPNAFYDNRVSADYDGDGKTDFAVARGNINREFYWYILNSKDNTMTAVQWGDTSDRLVPQDYDGDGKADIAVYRLSWWYILRSSDNQFYAEQFGSVSDLSLRGGDYDGDKKADLAVVRYTRNPDGNPVPMILYIRRSLDLTWASYDLGDARYTAVLTGDYDGDGKADVAVWQGNLWLWIRSSDNKADGVRFGTVTRDIPAQGDYDGDGKTDPAVYRRDFPQSYFYILQSRDGFKAVQWGNNTDEPEAGSGFIRAIGF